MVPGQCQSIPGMEFRLLFYEECVKQLTPMATIPGAIIATVHVAWPWLNRGVIEPNCSEPPPMPDIWPGGVGKNRPLNSGAGESRRDCRSWRWSLPPRYKSH